MIQPKSFLTEEDKPSNTLRKRLARKLILFQPILSLNIPKKENFRRKSPSCSTSATISMLIQIRLKFLNQKNKDFAM